MRCEICNKSMTYPVVDGMGSTHWYCAGCADEIKTAMFELEDDEDEWFLEDLMYDEWFLEDLMYLEELEGLEVDDDLPDEESSEGMHFSLDND